MNLSYYVNQTKGENHYKIQQVLFSLSLCLLIILLSIEFTLIFKPLYSFDIRYLNIEHESGFSKEEIIKNYDYVVNYFFDPKQQEFNLPSIPYSEYGQIHFKEVKGIFINIDILLITTGLISIIGLVINFKHKSFYFLKLTSSILILLPIILFISLLTNFNADFDTFHKIFFRNNYWRFDPTIDPIIKILPQQFFLHEAILILILIFLSVIFLKLLYKKLSSQYILLK